MASITRHRNRNSGTETFEYTKSTRTYNHTNGNSSYTEDARTHDFINKYESIDDTLTPNYYELVRSNSLLPMNPMIKVSQIVEVPKALTLKQFYKSKVRYSRGQPYWYTYDDTKTFLAVAPPSSNPANFEGSKRSTEDAAMNAALAALNGPIAQSLVTVGELGQTIKLILGAKKRFIKLFSDVFLAKRNRRGKIIKKRYYDRSVLTASADTYMEGRYGWRPLVGEIDSYIDAALRNLKPGFRVLSRSRTFTSKEEVEGSDIKIGNSVYSKTLVTEYEYRAKATLGYDLDLSAVEEWLYRLGITSWKTAAWELVPLSFVVDMFVNIGDTIGALEENPAIRITQSGMTTVMTVKSYYRYDHKYSPSDPTDGDGTWYFPVPTFTGPKSESVYYNREQVAPDVRLPSISMDLDIWQWLDVSILAKQVFSKGKR